MDRTLSDTPGESAPEWVYDLARATARFEGRAFRVVVLESDGRHSVTDFHALEEALQYAGDAASEAEYPSPLAYVFNADHQLVRRGRHYVDGL